MSWGPATVYIHRKMTESDNDVNKFSTSSERWGRIYGKLSELEMVADARP